jgi:hypothetical protein
VIELSAEQEDLVIDSLRKRLRSPQILDFLIDSKGCIFLVENGTYGPQLATDGTIVQDEEHSPPPALFCA